MFYNDAEFTDDDWKGIRSIYTSVKRDDPLKIGRFGLGFKSVFHLTGLYSFMDKRQKTDPQKYSKLTMH